MAKMTSQSKTYDDITSGKRRRERVGEVMVLSEGGRVLGSRSRSCETLPLSGDGDNKCN
jgi:hypothetical protein